MDDALEQFVVSTLRDLQFHSWSAAGATALVLYDWLLVFSDELDYIWRNRWCLGKVLYILQRYLTIAASFAAVYLQTGIGQPSVGGCRGSDVLDSFSSVIVLTITNAALIIRVYALYQRSKPVLYALIVLLTVLTICNFALLFVIIEKLQYIPLPVQDTYNSCLRICSGNCLTLNIALYIFPLIFQVVLITLTLYKARRSFRDGLVIPTLRVLCRDGLLYFVWALSVTVVNVLLTSGLFGSSNKQQYFLPFSRVMQSIIVSRIMINLRCQLMTPSVADGSSFESFVWRQTRSSGHTFVPDGGRFHVVCPKSELQRIDLQLRDFARVDVSEGTVCALDSPDFKSSAQP